MTPTRGVVGPNVVVSVADAIYAPLAAKQDLKARYAIRQATENDATLAVVEAYFTAQQARGELAGALLAWDDRAELSLAHQDLDTGATGRALGLPGLHLKMDVVGAKLRLLGDAILDSDTWVPQISPAVEQPKKCAAG